MRAWERAQPPATVTSWPVRLALTFGALALGAGVLLFVSAHWDALSPLVRFTLVVALTGLFHVGGALLADRLPALATALHGVGTVALGAGVYLTGQVFNLQEHWPGGLLLWAVGAALGWWWRRDVVQFALLAVLAPMWLVAEWIAAADRTFIFERGTALVTATGLFLLAVAYSTARRGRGDTAYRRLLTRLGTLVFLPTAAFLAVTAGELWSSRPVAFTAVLALGWLIALAVPMVVAWLARRTDAWPFALVVAWTLILPLLPAWADLLSYLWWAVGAVGLVAWGVNERRVDRINLGAAVFALTVFAFYFSRVLDKLGRSLGLLVVGLLFLAGGAALERVRRRLVAHAMGEAR